MRKDPTDKEPECPPKPGQAEQVAERLDAKAQEATTPATIAPVVARQRHGTTWER